MFLVKLVIGLVLSAGALAFDEDIFWIVAHAPLTATRLDPIMSPGGVSGHVHAIAGGSNFGPVYDYENSMKSECTTANIAVDQSNYWVPQMYNTNANGTYSLAGLSYVNTYYQMRRTGKEPVYEFPPGFRMLAGDPDRRTLDLNDPAQDAVRYVCLGGKSPEGHEFPPERCPSGMRAQIYFPHCWDGINSWLEGSKHVSYGEGRFDGGGKCPATHPKRIMGLFYEFIFHDHAEYEKGKRVWANGDNVGYSLHADFTNGWPTGFFSEIFSYGKQCSIGFDVKSCPALAPHYQEYQNCGYKGTKVDEDIGDQGAIARLPGNNPAVAGYQEEATFDTGSPSPVRIESVKATGIIMGTVKGDPAQSAPPDAIPQSGAATASSASAAVSAAATSVSAAVASASSTASQGVSSVQAASSASTSAMPTASASSALSSIGGVLTGESSESASASASASEAAAITSVASDTEAPAPSASDIESASMADPTSSASVDAASSAAAIPAPAASPAATTTPKSCGRGRKGRHGSKTIV